MLVLRLPARFPLRFTLALIVGALHALAFVDDATWPLQLAAQACLVALVVRSTRDFDDLYDPGGDRRGRLGLRRSDGVVARHAAVAGFGFGLGWFVTGISW